MTNRFKAWRLRQIKKYGQWYADLIINQLENTKTDWEFNFWYMKGYDHNLTMIINYGIYLD